jgi:hypothetical protein
LPVKCRVLEMQTVQVLLCRNQCAEIACSQSDCTGLVRLDRSVKLHTAIEIACSQST